jgi:hypothetical protein
LGWAGLGAGRSTLALHSTGELCNAAAPHAPTPQWKNGRDATHKACEFLSVLGVPKVTGSVQGIINPVASR